MSAGEAGRAVDPERRARLVLSVVGEPGDPRLTSLVRDLGAVQVLAGLHRQGELGELGRALADRLAGARPGDTLAAAQRRGARFVVPGDPEWPDGLDGLADAPMLHERGGVPVGLWVRGPLRLDEVAAGGVAVVGARSATAYGARVAGELAATVAAAGRGVISGAAFGIDQAAHRGALAVDGATVAVLASGVDRPYPTAHQHLIEHIAEVGLVVSEAAPGGAPTRIRFLARNRLIAALSRGVVVVEAAVRSGALNTANWADGLSLPTMGVPGPVVSAASQGVHEMIRARDALLVTRGEDVLEVVGGAGDHLSGRDHAPEEARDRVTVGERQVLDAVPVSRARGAESIARAAGLPVPAVLDALAVLGAAGLVHRSERGWRLARESDRITAGTGPGPSASG